jgi:hypothetical protein
VALNEPLFVECAQALARKTLAEGGATDADRVTYAFRRVLSRAPADNEKQELLQLVEKQSRRMAEGWVNPNEVATGRSEVAKDLPPGTSAHTARRLHRGFAGVAQPGRGNHQGMIPGLRTVWLLAAVGSGVTFAVADPGVPRTAPERLTPARLAAAHAARARFAAQRAEVPDFGVFEDLRAVIHVHAEDSNHTLGTRPEVLAAAKKTGVQVVMFTDHNGPKAETWRGMRDGVLFIAGAEEGGKGQLRFPAYDERGQTTARGELRFLSHMEERYEASAAGFAGMEICNRHTDAVLDASPLRFLAAATNDPASWARVVENFRAYPDEYFAAGCDYRSNVMAAWDRETQRRRVTGIGANDAHQNVVVAGITFDPYEVSFRNLCTHILAREFSEPAVREALREGHAYVSHDWLADPKGFVFGAVNNLGVFPMAIARPCRAAPGWWA